ncbi:hypothetical protein Aave_1905 [Paracidovorax citrulli AAC00-1]|uniref:Insertion element IS402-like domain-containing protein n=1 Tax=Paracidovorax citrulli (strain AAC00-1) TaxID=397945 RepID=A1TNF1_PARC0|nr:hypothetical protein Aave_1905 [Paracidovorax citrulli AAC00-1]
MQSRYAWRPHGKKTRQQRTAATATTLHPSLRTAKGGARKRTVSDEAAFNGILFVLHTGIAWEDLPQSLGYGSGMTCWRRLRDWNAAGVWQKLHHAMLVRLR